MADGTPPGGRLDGDLYDSATPSHRLTVIYTLCATGSGRGRLLPRRSLREQSQCTCMQSRIASHRSQLHVLDASVDVQRYDGIAL